MATSRRWSIRFQSTAANCGPAAVRNALLALGIPRSEEEIETLTGATAADGTGPKGILKALHAVLPSPPGVINEAREDVAILKLLAALQAGHPVICCVDNDEHWVAAVGTLGNQILLVADSADNELILAYSPENFLSRWEGPTRRPYYGCVL